MRFVRVAVLLLAAMPVRARHSDTPMVELLVPPVQSIPMDLAFHRAQGLVIGFRCENRFGKNEEKLGRNGVRTLGCETE